MVRTDSKEQKLDAFIKPTNQKTSSSVANEITPSSFNQKREGSDAANESCVMEVDTGQYVIVTILFLPL